MAPGQEHVAARSGGGRPRWRALVEACTAKMPGVRQSAGLHSIEGLVDWDTDTDTDAALRERRGGPECPGADGLPLPPHASTQRAVTAFGFGSVQPAADRLSLLPVVKQAGMP